MYHESKKRDARRAYVQDGATIAVIALMIGVPASTIRRWKQEAAAGGQDWDKERAANSLMGKGRDAIMVESVDQFVIHFKTAIDEITAKDELPPADKVKLMASLADSFAKVVASAGRVSPKISELGVALDTLQRFGDFVARQHPEAAQVFLTAVEEFGETLQEVYK